MGWRFRKSFKVMPGVRLNLSRSGLSATVGVSALSVNVGPRGVFQNVNLPGTGVSLRERVVAILPGSSPNAATADPYIPSLQQTGTEIRSASTEALNTEGLEQLRNALREAYEERAVLSREIAATQIEAGSTKSAYEDWNNGFLLKRLFKTSFSQRKAYADTAREKLDELRQQLQLTSLATHIEVEPEQAELYNRMTDQFAALSECQRIWDTLSVRPVNRTAERSAAYQTVDREPVSFSLGYCDLINWECQVPHLPNRKGGEMYIYPGFILYRASKQAFALIDSKEIGITFEVTRFIERDTVPTDSFAFDEVWEKCNKDGSRDLRFSFNRKLPVVRYGDLVFRSPTGLHEAFQFSAPAAAERFAAAWNAFRQSLLTGKLTMSDSSPESRVEFACPACRYSISETLAWIRQHRTITCPGCQKTIEMTLSSRGDDSDKAGAK
jgi:hypothetical protein